MAPKIASSVKPLDHEPVFGSRFLTQDADVWSQNAWDHVPPPDDQAETIAASLARQRAVPVPETDKPKYNDKPARHWDNFYKMNASNFFKNRKWLHLEFPELVAAARVSAGARMVVEFGCGAGNSVFPLLADNHNPDLKIYAYDYSSHAVKLVQNSPLYASPPCGSITASVWDLASDHLPEGLEPASADIVILVFVLSALHPDEWRRAVTNIHAVLKPGGLVLFRDYGRYDLTQLRFKTGRLLDDNFYIRGDNTRVYFFEPDELALLFTGSPAPSKDVRDSTEVVDDPEDDPDSKNNSPQPAAASSTASFNLLIPITSPSPPPASMINEPGPSSSAASPTPAPAATTSIHPNLLDPTFTARDLFAIAQLGVDRRLIVNRKRQLKMYRVWVQAKFQKL